MKKTLTWITCLSLSAVSPLALAVGLGQASVSSYLNAPLNASIPLLESSDYALDAIRVRVAEPSDFATAGLEWTPLAANVRAQVVEHQGQRQVRLSSEQMMQEPWLDLLLTVEFPGGEQFRDITLLFDPQGYSQNQTLPQDAAPSPPAPSNTATPPVTQPSSTVPPSAYIGSGDTLWSVAERVKPSQASVQQMMVALLEANPEAFPSGNINDLSASQTLSVPSLERIMARSHADADAAIKAMNEAWSTRRNGSLQAVSLPDVEVDSVAVAASETLTANEANEPANALAAGGSEIDEPAADEPVASDSAPLEDETDEPEALTRAELTEQLRLSQTMLQQVLEERELMRAELNELRGEVASLTQALSDALAAQQSSLEPLMASMDGTDRPGVAALVGRYQWQLALAAIVLLLALLAWLRKRREESWEELPPSDPVVRPTVSPSVEPKATPMPGAVPVSYPLQAHRSSAEQPYAESNRPVSPHGEMVSEPEPDVAEDDSDKANSKKTDSDEITLASSLNTDDWLVDDQGQEPELAGTPSYEKSQAAGLAEQGRQRRLGLHAIPDGDQSSVSLSPPPSSGPMRQMLVGLQVSQPAAESALAPESEPDVATDAGHRFIDYHPPVLNTISSSHDGMRTETPMQPTVEFASQLHSEPLRPAKQPRRSIEDEWEIEEVAFKPRGLDNSEPSKSSK